MARGAVVIRAILTPEAAQPGLLGLWVPTVASMMLAGWLRHDPEAGWVARCRVSNSLAPPAIQAFATRTAATSWILVETGLAKPSGGAAE